MKSLHRLLLAVAGCWIALGSAACQRSASEARPATSHSASRASVSPLPTSSETGKAGAGDVTAPSTERGRLLGWMPRDSLFALRVPRLGGTPEALSDTAIASALARMDLRGIEEPAQEILDRLTSEVLRVMPAAARLPSIVESVNGEFVLGLVHAHPVLLRSGDSRCPVTAVLYLELGADSESMRQFLAEVAQNMDGEAISTHEFRFDHKGIRVEALIHDHSLALRVGPSQILEPPLLEWLDQPASRSLLTADVVRTAPVLKGTHIRVWAEAFVQMPELWKVVSALAPGATLDTLQSLGLDEIDGLSVVSATAGNGFHEVVTVHSPERRDPLCEQMPEEGVDPAWLRFVISDANTAVVTRFDAMTPGGLHDALPPALIEPIHEWLEEVQIRLGVDLAVDFPAKVGPHLAISTRGSIWGKGSDRESFELCLAIEIDEPEALRRWIERNLVAAGLDCFRERHHLGKETYSTVQLPEDTGLGPELAYFVGSDYLILASSAATLHKSLMAARAAGKMAPESLVKVAESRPDAFCVAFQAITHQVHELIGLGRSLQAGVPTLASWTLPSPEQVNGFCVSLPNTLSWARNVPEGLRVEFQSAVSPVLLGGAGLVVGALASVALPSMAGARNEANESRAIQTLHELAAAQEKFRRDFRADRDKDGVGEFGYFAELRGDLPVSRNDGPRNLLPEVIGPVEFGCLTHGGYLFQLFLAEKNGRLVAEADGGGAARPLPPDEAERSFVIYTWPLRVGTTGQRAFVIDESGELFSTDNAEPGQGYSGFDRRPAGESAFKLRDGRRDRSPRSVRRGSDGGLWLQER